MNAQTPPCESLSFEYLDYVASPVFVLRVGPDHIPRYAAFNANARKTTKRPLSDYLGKTAIDVYDEAHGYTAYQRHCEVATSGQAITYQIELPIAGELRAVRTILMPQLDENGVVTHLFGSSNDLTERQKTLEAQISFDTLTTEMEQFVAMAAHDLRAPLRNVAMIADMLSDDFVDHGDGKAALIEMLSDVSRKSMLLISDVLDHARAMDTNDNASKFNFAALCRDICDVLDPHGHHQFTYTAAEIVADRTAMQIAVRNIIDNALKHGQREHLSINIIIQRGQNSMLDVMMTDSGYGFDAAALDFINGGSFRAESGYGLLGVRRMVQARGGGISAQNLEDGSGAVIRFSLPGEWLNPTNSLGDQLSDWHTATLANTPKIA